MVYTSLSEIFVAISGSEKLIIHSNFFQQHVRSKKNANEDDNTMYLFAILFAFPVFFRRVWLIE